jgi:hypothetical protein
LTNSFSAPVTDGHASHFRVILLRCVGAPPSAGLDKQRVNLEDIEWRARFFRQLPRVRCRRLQRATRIRDVRIHHRRFLFHKLFPRSICTGCSPKLSLDGNHPFASTHRRNSPDPGQPNRALSDDSICYIIVDGTHAFGYCGFGLEVGQSCPDRESETIVRCV